MINLKNELVSLRALEPEDIEVLYKWENDLSIWHLSNTLKPFSKYVLKQYIETSHLDIYQSQQLRLIIVENSKNKPVGAIDLFDFDPYHQRAGVGILIHSENDRKKGLAGNALDLLITYSFKYLKLHQLYCNITTDNEISLKLFQSKGFEISGTKKDWIYYQDKWYDEYLLQLVNK